MVWILWLKYPFNLCRLFHYSHFSIFFYPHNSRPSLRLHSTPSRSHVSLSRFFLFHCGWTGPDRTVSPSPFTLAHPQTEILPRKTLNPSKPKFATWPPLSMPRSKRSPPLATVISSSTPITAVAAACPKSRWSKFLASRISPEIVTHRFLYHSLGTVSYCAVSSAMFPYVICKY